MKMHKYEADCPYRGTCALCTESIRLFKELPKEEQIHLIENSIHTSHPRGTVLAHEGDAINEVLIIRSGRVKTCHIDISGDEHILDILHERQAIWHGMFLRDHTYQYDIVALSDVSLCRISRSDFMEVLRRSPETAMYLIEMLSTELQDANEKSFLLSIRSPEERIAAFLLFRDARAVGSIIEMKLDDIAASIGLRPETISRYLSRMEKEKLIRREGQGKLRVCNREKMKRLYTR